MGITFHCEYCGKKIQAPDEAGGKWGKCPSCHHKLYVPAPEAGEELKLEPVNENDQTKQKQLMAETFNLTQEILLEREDSSKAVGGGGLDISEKELTKNLILFLRQVFNGDLNEADQTAEFLVPYNTRAIEIIDRIAVSEMPEPELADIPPQVLSGLIRKLRSKFS